MRIIIYGRAKTIQRLAALLVGEGIEAVSAAERLDKMITMQKQDGLEMAIVDSLAKEAKAACHHINEFSAIPLVLVVGNEQTDWKGLQSLCADGYLPEKAGDSELAARLKAVLRRLLLPDRLRKSGFQHSASEFRAEQDMGKIQGIPLGAECQ